MKTFLKNLGFIAVLIFGLVIIPATLLMVVLISNNLQKFERIGLKGKLKGAEYLGLFLAISADIAKIILLFT